jgi:uncharacterized damage-inducible protein DinB
MTLPDLLDAWRTNNAVNQRLLSLCGDESFELKPGKGKTIRSNWVHIVGVRRMHLEESFRKEAGAIPKLDWKTASREEIAAALDVSCELSCLLFEKLDSKPTRWTAAKYFGYAVAHEAHHRSQIEIALRLGGAELSEEDMFSLWNWPKM